MNIDTTVTQYQNYSHTDSQPLSPLSSKTYDTIIDDIETNLRKYILTYADNSKNRFYKPSYAQII